MHSLVAHCVFMIREFWFKNRSRKYACVKRVLKFKIDLKGKKNSSENKTHSFGKCLYVLLLKLKKMHISDEHKYKNVNRKVNKL